MFDNGAVRSLVIDLQQKTHVALPIFIALSPKRDPDRNLFVCDNNKRRVSHSLKRRRNISCQ